VRVTLSRSTNGQTCGPLPPASGFREEAPRYSLVRTRERFSQGRGHCLPLLYRQLHPSCVQRLDILFEGRPVEVLQRVVFIEVLPEKLHWTRRRKLRGLYLTQNPANDSAPDFSPDGTRIAFASTRDGGGVYAIPALGGEERKIADHGNSPRFSPDGKWAGR